MSEENIIQSNLAKEIALCIIQVARDTQVLTGEFYTCEEFTTIEKKLFLMMMMEFNYLNLQDSELAADEISSLFTFAFARGVETACTLTAGQEVKLSLEGMLEGRMQMSANEDLIVKVKESKFPVTAAEKYLDWFDEKSDEVKNNPLLCLFEALKWTFRFGCHFASDYF